MTEAHAVELALEPLWPVFDAAVDSGDFSALTEGQRGVAFAWVLSGLVGNGGFASWVEGLGHRTRDAQDALTVLGAVELVPLLDRVVALYPTAGLDTEDARLSASEQWGDDEEAALDALDEAFYRLQERRHLVDDHAAAYVAAHPAEFSR